MIDLKRLSVEELLDINFYCDCGRQHEVKIGDIIIDPDILGDLPELLCKYKSRKILIVADRNTYRVAGDIVKDILSKDFVVEVFVYDDEFLVADTDSLGAFLLELGSEPDLILTIGSGTLNDITRYVSKRTGIPYVIIATAPSMDGYTSIISPLIRRGVKTNFPGVYPTSIIADINIMKEAPMHMLQAGLGDVLGKYTALSDWRMSNILGIEREEPYCANIAGLVGNAIEKCVEVAPQLTSRTEDAIRAIMEGLILAGLCIGLAGHSRPASGSEHQISHYIEMKFLENDVATKWLHGNKVGVGTLMIIEAYDFLFKQSLNQIKNSGKYLEFDTEKWRERIKDGFGNLAGEIFNLKEQDILAEKGDRQERMDLIEKNWTTLK
ncbi:MAG: sn-glycerol-1-phosphate dehydrogenase, partial [Clostridiales bacterium]|nr:sn-glycerol-1-phosphate dehydrogenase [Clostridiales bacterium]